MQYRNAKCVQQTMRCRDHSTVSQHTMLCNSGGRNSSGAASSRLVWHESALDAQAHANVLGCM
jgi:hypothetical protein